MNTHLKTVANDGLTGSLLRESSTPTAVEESLDLRAYIEVVLKHKWSILFVTLVAATLAFLYATSLEPKFRANVSLLYEPPSISNYGTVKSVTASDSYNSYFRNNRLFKSQQLIVGSHSFAEKMVDQYQLWKHPYFGSAAESSNNPSLLEKLLGSYVPQWFDDADPAITTDNADATADPLLRNQALGILRSGINVTVDEELMLINLGFVSSSPEVAAETANKLAEFYGQYELDQRMETYNRANSWLVDRTQELRDQLMKSEQALQEFKSAEDVGLAGGKDSIATKRLDTVFSELSDARNRVQSLSQTLIRLQRNNTNLSQSVNSDALLKFTGVREALDLELGARKELEQLAQVYGPKHPNMITATSNLERFQQKLNSEIELVVVELKADLNLARADETRLNKELDGLKTQTQSLQDQTFRLAALERARDTDQQLYDLFLTRFKELNVGNDINSSPSIQILNLAKIPGAAFWPNKGLIVLVVSLLTLALGVGLAFLQEILNNTIKVPEEVEEKLDIPLLGSLVELDTPEKGEELKAETFFIHHNKTPFAESIRTIRTGVMLSGLDDPHKVIAITSTVPGEGKTTVSMNLACALGQLEKVLVIDADMRRAALGPHFGIARNTKGLADVAAGLKELENCIIHFEEGGIDILPAGTLPPNPQELLSSESFKTIVEEVSNRYDRVIIDTAPTHLVSDPKLVVRWASALIYVVKADSTPINIIKQEIKELQKVDTPFIGVVLNSISKKKMQGLYQYGRYRRKGRGGTYGYGSYEYGYGEGYGYGYGNDSDSDNVSDEKTN